MSFENNDQQNSSSLQKSASLRSTDDFELPTRKRSSPVFMKMKSEPANIECGFGWQATHRKSLPTVRRKSSTRSTGSSGSRGDPTLDATSPADLGIALDASAVEEEHLERQKQALLKRAVGSIKNCGKGDPIYQDSPFSPPSGRSVQSEVAGPFCYATALEPVQEFLGNLSINSESSYLSSYNSLDDKAKILA